MCTSEKSEHQLQFLIAVSFITNSQNGLKLILTGEMNARLTNITSYNILQEYQNQKLNKYENTKLILVLSCALKKGKKRNKISSQVRENYKLHTLSRINTTFFHWKLSGLTLKYVKLAPSNTAVSNYTVAVHTKYALVLSNEKLNKEQRNVINII